MTANAQKPVAGEPVHQRPEHAQLVIDVTNIIARLRRAVEKLPAGSPLAIVAAARLRAAADRLDPAGRSPLVLDWDAHDLGDK